jgi:hypothetical protein
MLVQTRNRIVDESREEERQGKRIAISRAQCASKGWFAWLITAGHRHRLVIDQHVVSARRTRSRVGGRERGRRGAAT